MGKFFTRERFGRPQVLAGFLLLGFLAQCAWLLARGLEPLEATSDDVFRVQEGLSQMSGDSVAGTPSLDRMDAGTSPPPEVQRNEGYDPNHSPLWYLIAAVPLFRWGGVSQPNPVRYWAWLARAPYLLFGVLLGASLWYVSRRLYGDAGGYIALSLYCFSPMVIRSSTLRAAQPEMGAAWGTFGAVFTAIAVTHTLYAPREVVLWNWRRILLLGLSFALAIGTQFSLIFLLPIGLAFMLYLAPLRRWAAVAIWGAASLFGMLLLFASYFFKPQVFWQGMRHANFFPVTGRAYAIQGAYIQMLRQLGRSGPAMLIMLPVALIVYAVWRRSRYFGNTAPLLMALLLAMLALGTPHYPGLGFYLLATPFAYVFVSGIAADLLETRQRNVVLPFLSGLLIANALWNLAELARLGGG